MDWGLLMPVNSGADRSERNFALWSKADCITHFDTPTIRSLP